MDRTQRLKDLESQLIALTTTAHHDGEILIELLQITQNLLRIIIEERTS